VTKARTCHTFMPHLTSWRRKEVGLIHMPPRIRQVVVGAKPGGRAGDGGGRAGRAGGRGVSRRRKSLINKRKRKAWKALPTSGRHLHLPAPLYLNRENKGGNPRQEEVGGMAGGLGVER